MKRFYLTLCLLAIAITQCFAGGPAADVYIDMLNIVDGAVAAIKTDGSVALTADVYNIVEIDSKLGSLMNDLAAGNTVYYCSSGTEDIGGITYGALTEVYQPEVSTVAIGPIADTSFTQYSPGRGRVTPQLGVTEIPAGVYNRVSHMSNSNTSGRNVEIVYELWRADSTGAKISLIATSSVKLIDSPTGNAIQRLDNEYAVSAPVAMDTTDRLLEEFFFRRVGLTTGTAPTITRYIGGSRAGFLNLALPSGVVMRTDGSNSAAAVALKDLELTGNLIGVEASFTGAVSAGGVELMKNDGSNATYLDTISGSISAGETTISLPGGEKIIKGILAIGGSLYDISNPEHLVLDNSGSSSVLTFSEIPFDSEFIILRLR